MSTIVSRLYGPQAKPNDLALTNLVARSADPAVTGDGDRECGNVVPSIDRLPSLESAQHDVTSAVRQRGGPRPRFQDQRRRALIRQQRRDPLLCRGEVVESLPAIGVGLVETCVHRIQM